jgi:hypothetical protein
MLRLAATRLVKYENVPVPIGANNSYGSPVAFAPFGAAFAWFKVKYGVGGKVKYGVGGTIAVLETITVKVETVLDDGSTLYIEKSRTTAGSEWLSDDDYASLVKHGRDVVAVRVYARTNLPATDARAAVTFIGYG